ncbi:MAG TPA: hypothetical protein VFY99_11645 [Solirubrobacterales bacterium]
MLRRLIPALAACLLLAACGEDTPTITIEEGIPGGADPESVQVIEDWAAALAMGDVDEAASYFAIPSVAENGPGALRIRDRKDAVRFNESLPCGAELVRAEGHAGLVLATFRLRERPGEGSCGAGTGSVASTAFRIEDGEIAEWRRIPVPGEGGGGGGVDPAPSGIV